MIEINSNKKRIRVLHCPANIGCNPYQLAKAERKIGLDSWSVSLEKNYIGCDCDEFLTKRPGSYLELEIKRWWLLYRAIRNYDVIHFNFGSSIMPKRLVYSRLKSFKQKLLYPLYQPYAWLLELADLPLLKMLGKVIVVTYQGDDARIGSFCRENYEIHFAHEVGDDYYNKKSDALTLARINKFAKYADAICAVNPDLMHVLPENTEFYPYSNIDLGEWDPVYSDGQKNDKPMVVHAPTHKEVKGTKYIIEAIERIKRDGIDVDFVLITDMKQSEAKKYYRKADIIVDQLLAGWYGGLGVEVMALGKPVISYIREDDMKFIPKDMVSELPVINANLETIYSVLKEYLTTRFDELPKIGQQGRAYVENWHDPVKIAGHTKEIYEGALLNRESGK